jgi:hypothetical protein
MDEERATGLVEVRQLYGTRDLAAALEVPHGYVTAFLTAFLCCPILCPTHRWPGLRLLTHERIEQIGREHGTLNGPTSLPTTPARGKPASVVTAHTDGMESGHDGASFSPSSASRGRFSPGARKQSGSAEPGSARDPAVHAEPPTATSYYL